MINTNSVFFLSFSLPFYFKCYYYTHHSVRRTPSIPFCPFSIPLCCLPAPGVFLICWLPFFVTHILNTHCRTCYVPPELYSAFTWLGYVNSALNPVIYTTFNIEFRRAFIKILSCWGRSHVRKFKWKWGCAPALQVRRGAFSKQWPERCMLCVLHKLHSGIKVKHRNGQTLQGTINANTDGSLLFGLRRGLKLSFLDMAGIVFEQYDSSNDT